MYECMHVCFTAFKLDDRVLCFVKEEVYIYQSGLREIKMAPDRALT